MSWLRGDVDELFRRVQNMFVRGTIGGVDDKPKWQEVALELEDGHKPTKVEHAHPYGISFHPHKDAEVMAVALGGNRDHLVVLTTGDRRYRLTDLKEGEFAIHDDQGQKVHFLRDGVLVETGKPVTVKGSDITLEATGKIVLKAPNVHLGDEGGKLVHRKGDVDSDGDVAVGSAAKVWAV